MAQTCSIDIPRHRSGLGLLFEIKKDILNYFMRLMQTEGAYAGLSLGGKKVVMLNDATGIQHVLQSNADNYCKSQFYDVLRPLLGNSIIMSEGDVWVKQRQMSAPAFSNGRLNEMSQKMTDVISRFLNKWDDRSLNNHPVDVSYESMSLTLQVMMETLFNEDGDILIKNLQSAINVLAREAEERIWFPFKLPQWLIYKLPKYADELKFLNETLQYIIDQRRSSILAPDDLLNRLLNGYDKLPKGQKELRDQAMTFLLAGHESTASGLSWSLYQLSKHPKVFEQMRKEVDEFVGDRPPTFDDLKSLPYTRQVYDEVLRTYPVVWTISRVAQNDDLVPLDDGRILNIPANTSVMLCPYSTHRREVYWANPEAFDPEHFSTNQVQNRPKFSYFPFGGGPRLCLGFKFAQIESLFALIMIAQRYDIALVPGQNIHPIPSINLRPNGPMLMRFHLRKNVSNAYVSSNAEQKPACPYHSAAA